MVVPLLLGNKGYRNFKDSETSDFVAWFQGEMHVGPRISCSSFTSAP